MVKATGMNYNDRQMTTSAFSGLKETKERNPMEQFCRKINMPEEVTQKMVELQASLEEFPCLDLLMEEATWAEGLEQIKEAVGEDPQGFKRLCSMLRCAMKAKTVYDRLGISEEIYVDTMAAFSRFVRENMESYGFYGFNRGFWTTRQVSCKLFRIGQMEFELTAKDGTPVVSLHIPTDVDLRYEILRPSMEAGLSQLYRIFPEYADKPVYCHSWLLSPILKDMLPPASNILRFQEMFDIQIDETPGKDVLLWVFKNPKLPKEDLPENTSLQRKLKRFYLEGNQFRDGKGYLRNIL